MGSGWLVRACALDVRHVGSLDGSQSDRNQEDRAAADGMNALARPSVSGRAEIVHGTSGKPSVLPDAVMGEVVLSDA